MRADLPQFGLGTWQNDDPDACARSVQTALDAGYRHVDTAQAYGNEAAVGRGIRAADVDREDVFLATKVDTGNLAYDDVLETTAESLDRLGVDAVDLLYVHWPIDAYDAESTLAAFDELYEAGAIRNVGVSNFEPRHLAAARDLLDAPLFANQVEMHPLLQQSDLLAEARDHDEWLVAYSPLARGAVTDVPELQAVAEKHDATPAQVSLAWLLGKGVPVIPKATSEAHIRENWAARDLDLDADDVERIESIDREERFVDFEAAPWN
ncbi:MAG: aldo/keto reductase [Haloarculaceae archaeon]